MTTVYACQTLIQQGNQIVCKDWVAISDYSSFKLTNEQMATFIFSIALLFATVAIFKFVRRSL